VSEGRIAIIALAVLFAELAWLIWRGRISMAHAAFLPTTLAGLTMMIALYIALSGGGALWIAIFLLLSLAAHLIDVFGRLAAKDGVQRPRIRGSSASRKPSPM
jgi:hypothetical protein